MKKKGSALILSILMLSFFMTITLTMYYIARNRSKRSMYKIKGMRISSGLDSGSAIAHYELYLADEYVSRGYPYASSESAVATYVVDDDYTEPSSTTQYTTEDAGTVIPITGEHYTGVVLNNYNEYFGARWDATTGSAMETTSEVDVTSEQSIQPWIAEDKVVDSELASRAWMNNTGEKIVRLWTEDTTGSTISVGGYRLTDIDGAALPLDISNTTDSTIKLTYEKIVSISSSSIGVEDYRITYVEKVVTDSDGYIETDELDSMTVEKLK